MQTSASEEQYDCVVVGASFAGLACATALARAGRRVLVLEEKSDAGEKLHTTGILVKDVIDQVALLDRLPAELVRRIDGVRLYAPNMRFVDLAAPGYYFLATDTPGVMRWLAAQAEQEGARIAYKTQFRQAQRTQSGFLIDGVGTTRYLVGADGPGSRLARALGLGENSEHLFGAEYEYAEADIPRPDQLHCFIDRKVAQGYIGWVVAGVGVVQVGLARRVRGDQPTVASAMNAFLQKIAPVVDLRGVEPLSVRAGMIPCGGVVSPVAAPRALLIGDAAGMVSPVTAGGIHTALKHGLAAGHAIADFLDGKSEDPNGWFVNSYPRFRTKRRLRFLFDHFQSDLAFNLLLGTRPMRAAAGAVYFHHKGVFVPGPADRAADSAAAPGAVLGGAALDKAGPGPTADRR
jgi:digeranylgeranylglycerophospholipid reductase